MVPPPKKNFAMRDSLLSPGPRVITRSNLAAGECAAIPLGDLITSKRPPAAAPPCVRHRWRVSLYYRECAVCGLVEDKVPSLPIHP